MIESPPPISRGLAKSELEDAFLTLLPRIEQHGRIYFRHLRPHRRADAVQEMRAVGWKWLLQLHQRGKDPTNFVTAFVGFLARAVNSGRRVCGMEKSRDVLNPLAQKRHGFRVEHLPTFLRKSHEHLYSSPLGQEIQDELEERLCDNTITPPPEQAAFRIDFPAWLKTLTPRERRIVRGMMRNERTLDLSKRFDVSPGRISQLRRELHDDWLRFLGDRDQAGPALA
jgi:hypothetical protein